MKAQKGGGPSPSYNQIDQHALMNSGVFLTARLGTVGTTATTFSSVYNEINKGGGCLGKGDLNFMRLGGH